MNPFANCSSVLPIGMLTGVSFVRHRSYTHSIQNRWVYPLHEVHPLLPVPPLAYKSRFLLCDEILNRPPIAFEIPIMGFNNFNSCQLRVWLLHLEDILNCGFEVSVSNHLHSPVLWLHIFLYAPLVNISLHWSHTIVSGWLCNGYVTDIWNNAYFNAQSQNAHHYNVLLIGAVNYKEGGTSSPP